VRVITPRLTAEAPLPITGGVRPATVRRARAAPPDAERCRQQEHQPVAVYHDYLAGKAFDIVQPHLQVQSPSDSPYSNALKDTYEYICC
jgi:hypothetical protein